MAGEAENGGPVLEAVGVSLRFGGVRALTDVSFAVQRGEVFSIIGPNGAGKTSMVNCVSGRYRPTEGRIRFDGRDITRLPTRKRAGDRHRPHLPEPRAVRAHDGARQHHGRPPPPAAARLRARDAVVGRRRPAGGDRAPRARSRRSSTSWRSSTSARRWRAQLSYGLRKRVELARAMALKPEADPARRADGGHEPRGKGGHGPLHHRPQRGVGHDRAHDRARHGRGDGHLAPRGGARLRPQDRRRPPGGGDGRPACPPRLSRRGRRGRCAEPAEAPREPWSPPRHEPRNLATPCPSCCAATPASTATKWRCARRSSASGARITWARVRGADPRLRARPARAGRRRRRRGRR